jgi:hypothetical protein
MKKEVIKQKIRELIWTYVLDNFEITCKYLIPKREIKYLPTENTKFNLHLYFHHRAISE